MNEGPASIPEGLVVSLSRGKVLPGASAEADRWMTMLDDRADYLYWVSVHGAEGATELDMTQAIDRDHLEQARRTKHPGWVEAEPQVLMLPAPVRKAVLDWAMRSAD